jgi:hypothetical protein
MRKIVLLAGIGITTIASYYTEDDKTKEFSINMIHQIFL